MSFGGEVTKSHAFSLFKEKPAKYKKDFTHFSYTNPNAPKGGKVMLSARGTFDSLNPYILKGTPDPFVGTFVFSTLLTSSDDELYTSYGYVAEAVEWPEDRSWVIFTLREGVTFHDGSPLTAEDVSFSFKTLVAKGTPSYQVLYKNVKAVTILSQKKIRFDFKKGTGFEMPAVIGRMPILSKKYYTQHDFSKSSMKVPLGSGPYKIKKAESGKYIVYERVKDWWGEKVPSQRGKYNFDEVGFDYYRDINVAYEAFKSGAVDLYFESSSKNWHTGYTFPAVIEGRVLKENFPHQAPTALTGFFFNTRRALFEDRRVREALNLAFDFEWVNKNFFHGVYKRIESLFSGTDFEAKGNIKPETEKILQPFKEQVSSEVFNKPQALQASDGSGYIRERLIRAMTLLKEAGWHLKEGKLTHMETGKVFEFEIFTTSLSYEKIIHAYAANLKKLGIKVTARLVDPSQFEVRQNTFDFDVIVSPTMHVMTYPGTKLLNYWDSSSADVNGSMNFSGAKNPVIDALISKIIGLEGNFEALKMYAHALDRVVLREYLLIPLWSPGSYRVAYWDKFSRPKILPKYTGVSILTWWYDEKKAAKLN